MHNVSSALHVTAFFVWLDGKSYDAFLLCYDSDADVGLKDCDRKWLESVLETSYGYNLCLYDRDILPGTGMALYIVDFNN